MSIRASLMVPLLAVAASLSLAGCGSDDQPQPPATTAPGTEQPAPPEQPGEDIPGPGDMTPDTTLGPDGQEPTVGQEYDGASVQTERITANEMEMDIPKGLRIPTDALVTQADEANIMMAEEDPDAVVKAVTESAEAAGYELYAEGEGGWVWVGHGNAVYLMAMPQAQMLTWGPEAMKDELRKAVDGPN